MDGRHGAEDFSKEQTKTRKGKQNGRYINPLLWNILNVKRMGPIYLNLKYFHVKVK